MPLSRPVAGLPPGVVLLKGYLTLDEQIRIVLQIRGLGIGPSGFYTPSYGTGARLSLRMMCLGLHWEPRTSKYEATRYGSILTYGMHDCTPGFLSTRA